MIVYDGKYCWNGTRENGKRPISWWAGQYQLKIIDLSDNIPGVHIIKPLICILTNTGRGASIKNCVQNLAKSVCRDFNLDIKKVLWVEYFPNRPEQMEVAMFKPVTKIGSDTLYSVKWRSVMKNELEVIKRFVTTDKTTTSQ